MSNQVNTDILRIAEEGQRWLRYLSRQRALQAVENIAITLFLFGVLVIWLSRTIASVELAVLGLLLGIPFAIISFYFFLKTRAHGEFKKWKDRMAELKQRESVSKNSVEETPGAPYSGALESALELMDQMATWSLDMVKIRGGWAWTYAGLAFFLAMGVLMYVVILISPVLSQKLAPISFPLSVAFGGLVWFIVKSRTRNEAERRTRMLQEWRRRLEEEKNEFLRSL